MIISPSSTRSCEGASHLTGLMQQGTDFLGSQYAIMGGAMSWVSERNLVAALSNAGAFGVIACSSMTPELLDNEIKETKKLLRKDSGFRGQDSGSENRESRIENNSDLASQPPNPESRTPNPPFGVNLIIMHPQMPALIQTCIDNQVTHEVLAGGIPRADMITPLKDAGIKVIGFAPAAGIGKKLIKMGADALVIEGSEAGGHIGPVSTSVLAQEVLPVIREVPVFVAGGIGRGETMASYLEQGAAGVQLGTRFVCATECIAHDNFKKAFIKGAARNATASVQVDPDFPVIPVRALANKATDAFTRTQHEVIAKYRGGEMTKEEAQLAIEHFWAGALRKAVIDGDVERGSVMAGQSVGMITKEQPVAEILAELVQQAETFLAQTA